MRSTTASGKKEKVKRWKELLNKSNIKEKRRRKGAKCKWVQSRLARMKKLEK